MYIFNNFFQKHVDLIKDLFFHTKQKQTFLSFAIMNTSLSNAVIAPETNLSHFHIPDPVEETKVNKKCSACDQYITRSRAQTDQLYDMKFANEVSLRENEKTFLFESSFNKRKRKTTFLID